MFRFSAIPRLQKRPEQGKAGLRSMSIPAFRNIECWAFATVVRDHIGNVLWLDSKIGVSNSPLHAEAQALMTVGCQSCCWLWAGPCQCGTQMLLNIVKDVNSQGRRSLKMGHEVTSILSIRKSTSLEEIGSFLGPSRETNKVVDALATWSLK